MQAIVGLSRGLSRAFVNGVVSRSQNPPESSHGSEAEHRLGEEFVVKKVFDDFMKNI